MAEATETVVAESSPAAVEAIHEPIKPQIDPLQEGPMGTWTREQRNEFRSTGKMPETKPIAEPAPAEKPAEGDKPENATESAPEDDQEPPEGIGNKARKRFEKLLAENKALRAAQQAKPDATPAPSAAPQATQMAPARPEPTVNDLNEDGTLKYADYGAFVKDLGRWSAEQAIHESRQRDTQEQQSKQILDNIQRDRTRYGDEYETVLEPTAGAINSSKSLHPAVKEAIGTSDVMPDLIYTLGTDQDAMKELEKLSMKNPVMAIKYIGVLEAGIRQELSADKSAVRAPEPKHTSAPKPPAEVGGRASAPGDALVAAATANDFRAFRAEINRRSLAGIKTG